MIVDLTGRLTCTVPEAGAVLGISRDASYAAAARGEIPTLRLGRRLIVPVAKLHELLGIPTRSDGPGATPGPTATTDDTHGADHEQKSQQACVTPPSLRNVC